MKITILTYGSRGDVQPFIPLSARLISRGHYVKLAAPSRFRDLVEGYGIQFVPLPGEPEYLSRRFNDAGYNFIKMIGGMMDYGAGIAMDILHQTEAACEDADMIIHSFLHAVGAHTYARERNVPDIHIQTFPMFTPTGDYPNVTLPDLRVPFLNFLTHGMAAKIFWWGTRLGFEQLRRRAGLPKRKLYWPFHEDTVRPPTPILCAWSPSLLRPSSGWPSNVHVTGWYFFKSNRHYVPPPQLETFLNAGTPPVCVSFGSMVHRDAEKVDRIVRESMAQTGNRGILLSGWSQVEHRSSENILYLDAVPHDWLLPHCKMIIHHGGAGTTSAGLQAGIPNIVVPFAVDQPFWGRSVHAIGAGPAPIPVKKLSIAMLTQAIKGTETNTYRERAAEIGRRIHSEKGVDVALQLIEKHSDDYHR
jgi:sterol 3beta-glucosyltransferase